MVIVVLGAIGLAKASSDSQGTSSTPSKTKVSTSIEPTCSNRDRLVQALTDRVQYVRENHLFDETYAQQQGRIDRDEQIQALRSKLSQLNAQGC